MLTSVVLFFDLLEDGTLPLTHGDWLHGAFYHHLQLLDPGLANEVHESGGGSTAKPFCISPLFSKEFALRGHTIHANQGTRGWFRIASIHPALSRAIENMHAVEDTWILRGRHDCFPFRVTAATSDPARHSWAGHIAPLQLIAAAQADQRHCPDRVFFEFLTPTSGPPAGAASLLPSPHLLFAGLHARAALLLPEGVLLPSLDEITAALTVSSYELRTEMWDYQLHKRRVAGFLGRCELIIDRRSAPEVQWAIHFLAGLAFYSGIGYGTGWGRGMVRRTRYEEYHYRGSPGI